MSFLSSKNLIVLIKSSFLIVTLEVWIFYFILRLWLTIAYGLTTDVGGINLFFEQINKIFYTVYIGLEGFIIPYGLITFLLLKRKIYVFNLMITSYFFLIVYVAQSVYDISRSMSYILLFVVILIMLIDKYYPKFIVEKIIGWVAVINIFSLFTYPLFAQLYRVRHLFI